MSKELELLFEYTKPDAVVADYRHAVVEENVLGKPTHITREHTARKLKALYGLDPAIPVFRAMRRLWEFDSNAQPLLAMLCAYARDPLLRMTGAAIIGAAVGERVVPEVVEDSLRNGAPGRFSNKSITSTSRNILGSWTYSLHLAGRRTKVRRPVIPTPASTTYALFLGFLEGNRAQRLFTTAWTRLLDAPEERLIDQTRIAARRGWLDFHQVGSVIEVRFPDLISAEEEAMTRE